jgi:hypothetical protein
MHNLKKKGRFSDSRVTANKYRRTGHDAATENPVHFINPNLESLRLIRLDGIDRYWETIKLKLRENTCIRNPYLLFNKPIPLTAGGAFSQPFWRLMAAIPAEKVVFIFFNEKSPYCLISPSVTTQVDRLKAEDC